jgi:hypothetical protein
MRRFSLRLPVVRAPSLSTLISLIGLAVSIFVFVQTQFGKSEISAIVGPSIEVYYTNDGGVGFYIPATFLNRSSKTGAILKSAITLFRKDNPEQRFYMEWRSFASMGQVSGDNYAYHITEWAHAIAVAEKSADRKLLWITWRTTSEPKLVLSEGEYVLTFHYWNEWDPMPHNDTHTFTMDQSMQKALETNKGATVTVGLDRNASANRIFTSHDERSLFGTGRN